MQTKVERRGIDMFICREKKQNMRRSTAYDEILHKRLINNTKKTKANRLYLLSSCLMID